MKTLEKEEVAQEIKLHARCSRKVIAAAVSAVSGGIGKASLPILNHVLLEVQEDNMLRMVAGDTILTVEKTIPIVSYEHGAVTVDAKTFSDATSSLPEGDIEIELGAGSKLHTRGGKAQFKLFTLPAEEYPRVVVVPDTVHFTVPQRELRLALKQCIFCCLPEGDPRPLLTGVVFEMSPESLTIAATDVHRLSVRTLPTTGIETAGNVKFIVPARALSLVMKHLREEDGDTKVSLTGTHARFEIPEFEGDTALSIMTQVIEGSYPNYQRAIPEESVNKVTVDREDFLTATKRAYYVGKSNAERVVLSFRHDELGISADSFTSGSLDDSIEYASEKTFEEKHGVNGRYLIQCLENMPTSKVTIELTNPLRPLLIRPVFTEKEPAFYDYLHLLFGMQLT